FTVDPRHSPRQVNAGCQSKHPDRQFPQKLARVATHELCFVEERFAKSLLIRPIRAQTCSLCPDRAPFRRELLSQQSLTVLASSAPLLQDCASNNPLPRYTPTDTLPPAIGSQSRDHSVLHRS